MKSSIPPLKNGSASLSERVYKHLRDLILAFEMKPGEPVSEKQISEALRVSRTPVREALAKLVADHLVDVYPQRGTYIAPLRLEDLERSQFMREALEIALVQRVSQMSDRSKLTTKLRAEIDLQRTLAQLNDSRRFYESDENFHRLIAEHAGLPDVWDEISRVKLCFDRFRKIALSTGESNVDEITDQHSEIVNAIESRDASAAANNMRLHLRRIMDLIYGVAAIKPEYFEDPESFARKRAL